MVHHLGYKKNQPKLGTNFRNGYSTKSIITGDGTCGPQLVKKHQIRIAGMDNQILSLYAKGMISCEIAAAFSV